MLYNKKTEYESEIKPQLIKLKKLCIKHNIPFFFSACVENTENTSNYENEILSALSKGLDLNKDFFPGFVKVTLGFETIYPQDKLEINPGDIDFNDFVEDDLNG